MDNDPTVHVITDAAPTMEPKTRSRVKQALLAVTAAGATLLAADAGIRRFKDRKSVKVVVEDKPESENQS